MRRFTRQEIVDRLRAKRARKAPIIIGGAGVGIIAKMCDKAGIDLIMAYNTGPFRMDGTAPCVAYMGYGDSNAMTMELGRHLFNVVENTPIIAGIGAGDPYRDIDRLIDKMIHMGFSGITNVPTAGAFSGWWRDRIDTAGAGYPEEVKMVASCNKKNVFTVAYAYKEDEVRAMVAAGVDVLSAHVGATSGGQTGFVMATSMEEAIETTQKLYEVAIKENPHVIFVAHGGPFEGPEEVQHCFDHTDVHGFIAASSIERLPVEKAVTDLVKEFKALKRR